MIGIFGLPGHWEWIIIVLIALLLFSKKIPELAKSLGRGIVEFKKGITGAGNEEERKKPPNVKEEEEKKQD